MSEELPSQHTLRSYGAPRKKESLGYKHAAPLGRATHTILLYFKLESASYSLMRKNAAATAGGTDRNIFHFSFLISHFSFLIRRFNLEVQQNVV